MDKVKIISMYLPQYHRVPENDKFWGDGFTDWVSVKKAESLFHGHRQPRVPLNENYYDLSLKKDIEWQVCLAKQYGVYGFGIYHYWFSSKKVLLTKPAEIILNNPQIDMPFFFAWDNVSWKRTWSNLKGNDWAPVSDSEKHEHAGPEILIDYILGDEKEWKAHFEFLFPYFMDKRYIRYKNKPIFIVFHYSSEFEKMGQYWNQLAQERGLDGVQLVFRYDQIANIPEKQYTFTYEPTFSGWGDNLSGAFSKIYRTLGVAVLRKYDYDKVWKKILKNASFQSGECSWHGAFVDYDDTPRRGRKGTIILGGSPPKFKKYISSLLDVCREQRKEFIFLTAWNEWGEGAYLEPDNEKGYAYLEALKSALIETENFTGEGKYV